MKDRTKRTHDAAGGFAPTRGRQVLALAVFLAACYAAAVLGGFFTPGGTGGWYASLRKPSFNPPGWLFGPVWTVLYACMAVAGWLIWRRRGLRAGAGPLAAFAVQLLLNAAWSPVFFGLRAPGPAFGVLVALWLAIVVTAAWFFRVSRPAGLLLLPYLAWVTFAGALNFQIWRLNA